MPSRDPPEPAATQEGVCNTDPPQVLCTSLGDHRNTRGNFPRGSLEWPNRKGPDMYREERCATLLKQYRKAFSSWEGGGRSIDLYYAMCVVYEARLKSLQNN